MLRLCYGSRDRHFYGHPGEGGGGGEGTSYKDLYGEAPPERGTFFRLQVPKMT